ncbi:hypothetical protein [Argonema galeatum]|uniref:hypothetical protein n=1 Tax=Argonema galeatum TaxID=2942762 RepID=UPI00201281B7|nr:hypothetical protein [Argonema galeatum]MCL1467790.1 hypothetical protein [Argonema galeatum A003/A1]
MPINPNLSYRTQSVDTSIEAEQVQFRLWRKMTPAQKEALFRRVAKRGPTLALMGIKTQYPNASKDVVRQQYIRKRLGQEVAHLLSELNYKGELMIEDPIWLAHLLAVILNSLNIPYYVGGSVASSLQGEVRYTEDLDLVVNIQPTQIQPLIDAMAGQFYISEVAVEDAMSGRTLSFNVIHLTTTEKADIFVMRDDEFSRSKMARRQLHIPDGDIDKCFYVCTPEDTVLQKLVWFRMTARESQKQWRDILGVLKLQGERLDFEYLNQWAQALQLTELLAQALREAGLSG